MQCRFLPRQAVVANADIEGMPMEGTKRLPVTACRFSQGWQDGTPQPFAGQPRGLAGRRQRLESHWDSPWGDRRQELVFIGVGMDETGVRGALDQCLASADPRTRRSVSGLVARAVLGKERRAYFEYSAEFLAAPLLISAYEVWRLLRYCENSSQSFRRYRHCKDAGTCY